MCVYIYAHLRPHLLLVQHVVFSVPTSAASALPVSPRSPSLVYHVETACYNTSSNELKYDDMSEQITFALTFTKTDQAVMIHLCLDSIFGHFTCMQVNTKMLVKRYI